MTWDVKKLNELIKNKTKESNTLEFKRAASLYNSLDKAGSKHDELSKDVSSMANSNGGIIIYGIKEYNLGNDKCKAESIDHVDTSRISEEWLEQVINSRITPRIENIRITKIEFDEKGSVFVLDIPKSNTAHQAQDKKYYKRFSLQSLPMDDWEVKDVINRQLKPQIQVKIFAYPEYMNNDHITTYDLDIVIHNLGMIGAHYINCFFEIDKDAWKYIKSPKPTIYENHLQIIFSNKLEQKLTLGEQTITLPSFYDPLLPLVYKSIGMIKVRKGFIDNQFNIEIKIATESTYTTSHYKSNEVKIIQN